MNVIQRTSSNQSIISSISSTGQRQQREEGDKEGILPSVSEIHSGNACGLRMLPLPSLWVL
ncbi:hypothetical protein E2C01_029514 [Portunus trituberculatus]|uniref:Uncharacterized protein n=1 Tax=Portunus trituberculatus TaxID=210409 RepID=A0A5B7ES31_PORTR|nr:hypothetical protein [Portunus trituberculatus]